MAFFKVLRPKKVVNGRLILVETKSACYYRYLIFDDDKLDFSYGRNITYSDWDFTSWKSAQSAAIKFLTPPPLPKHPKKAGKMQEGEGEAL